MTVVDNQMSVEELQAEIERLTAQNEELTKVKELSFKVSPKGAVSVYGLGRFPVTLYANQMIKLLEANEMIREFIADHTTELKTL